MSIIALPKKIEFKKGEEANQTLVVIEPCFRGHGITLGNALRRVLLSSLPGAAVVGVKIKGAGHEFTGIHNLKEDILEIVLNFKKLRLKAHSEEVIKLELEARGEKEVKASDIKKNSQVEIINPDLVLANLTDIAGSLNMEIFVSRGMGYETIESREDEKHEIGYIEIDSVFTPIVAVSVNVENVRVGKMTNWDKLILDIKTDGTITPEDAFKKAVEILIEQFSALIGKKPAVAKEKKAVEGEEAAEDKKDKKTKEDKKKKLKKKASQTKKN
ncbi:DNA-directed RNA polymerase subunit alpha [Patescibacteria group bacterium]|nr:DNA-directed RNA polymerase subunit alpha [Candidatus Falkowbacteria bacterium]MBU3905768.1 DNA-directed RNA polymerase subunit alpha [Patescibacteria group bacterium]MCG2698531.1 DNA-directed RNA polymerase subunit alpha [Candidatus Parcubacteria bacterium]MBU4014926.1 DNA-directed RNA polymerase subunit alpha [Patescibacteria group bacterium]MBU4026126.1 DNA-directed RNA polymerase subunit alpha [Patescibacteria group bacterium]